MKIIENKYKEPDLVLPREVKCFVCESTFEYGEGEFKLIKKLEKLSSMYWFKFWHQLTCPCCNEVINIETPVEE